VPEVLVRARGLTKRFGSFTAVDGINFDLFRGEAFGFLGPNGAGKSSTMRMLGCVSPPTSGNLTILGGDPVRDGPAIRSRLGVVPQEDTLDNELTVRENLLVYGRYFGLPRKLIARYSTPEVVELRFAPEDRDEALLRLKELQNEGSSSGEMPARAGTGGTRGRPPGRWQWLPTFYPLSVYPRVVAVIVEWTPLYQGVVILRDLVLGVPSPDLAWRAAYLVALGVAGLALAGQRIAKLLLVWCCRSLAVYGESRPAGR
jgi:ABC-type Fe3+/spermidine/putrescine transport system ATPase subunit